MAGNNEPYLLWLTKTTGRQILLNLDHITAIEELIDCTAIHTVRDMFMVKENINQIRKVMEEIFESRSST